jgi:citrate synthase
MSTTAPVTRIGSPTSDTTRLEIRGRPVLDELLGRISFAEAFFLIVTGRRAGETERKVMDAALVVLMDHGLTPTALVSRLVADSLPDHPQVAIAAGAMMVGDKFAGTMAGAGRYLVAGAAVADREAWAEELVRSAMRDRRRLPGFGHPYYHPVDPRAQALFAIAEAAGVDGRHIGTLRIVGQTLDRLSGRAITLNATGALGAILCEIGFPVAAMRGLAVVSRAAGLTAHVTEEGETPVAGHLLRAAEAVQYEPISMTV